MSTHPLVDALAELPETVAALAALRSNLDTIADWAVDLDRARRPHDPMGNDPAFEGVRQRQRAIDRTVREITEKLDYLGGSLANVQEDLDRLTPAGVTVSPEAQVL